MAKRPGGAMLQSETPTHSQLVPLLTKWQDVGKKSELGPIVVTILVVLLLFVMQNGDLVTYDFQFVEDGKTLGGTIYTSWYLVTVCAFLMFLSLFFIRKVAGKAKSWALLTAVMVFTGYLLYLFQTEHAFLFLYKFFHITVAGGEVKNNDSITQTFVKHFLGTGFFEETFKAMPVLALAIASGFMPPMVRAKFGIEEPLDGILLGAASGGGFAFAETIGQYLPNSLIQQWQVGAAETLYHIQASDQALNKFFNSLNAKQMAVVTVQGMQMLGWKPALALLLPRSLGEAFGHMAYAGCFGYFIGLAVMKPQQRIKILAIGLVSASLLHALWDTLADASDVLLGVVAILSYMVLAAGILKAREISPNRAGLLPSIFVDSLAPAPMAAAYAGGGSAAAAAPAVPFAAAPRVVATAPPPPNPLPAGTASLRVGTKYLVIVPGLRLMAHQVPGLQTQSTEGLVAEVTRNPNDPGVLGLTNLSTTAWEVVTSSNTRREIQPGQTVKLAPGTKIDFGETDGAVS